MDRQGIAIKWILIMGIGTLVFLAGTATLMRRAGLGSGPVRVHADASPFSGDEAIRVYEKIGRNNDRGNLAGIFHALRENGPRPRLLGTMEQPDMIWTVTEGQADAPGLLITTSLSGENGLLAAAWLAELARVVPRRGTRHRIMMVWRAAGEEAGGFRMALEALRAAESWRGRIAGAIAVSIRRGSTPWIARDARTPTTVWDTLLDASRRAGYVGLARPLPVETIRSDGWQMDSMSVAGIEIGIPEASDRDAFRDGLKVTGDAFYHALVTLGYDMIVRLGMP